MVKKLSFGIKWTEGLLKITVNEAFWHMPVIPAVRETEAGS